MTPHDLLHRHDPRRLHRRRRRTRLDWLFVQDQDEDGPLNYKEFIAGVGAIVMGAHDVRVDPGPQPRTGEGWAYDMPAWVMTHARPAGQCDGADVRFAQGDVAAVHAEMAAAAGGKGLWVVGGGDLVGQFADAGLLDEMIMYIAPVTLGAGRPILPRRLDLRLEESRAEQGVHRRPLLGRGPGTWGS